MRRFATCKRGATAIEYGLFAGLAIMVLMSGVSTIGERVGGTMSQAGAAMAAIPAQAPEGMQVATPSHARLIHIEETQDEFLSKHK